MNPSQFTTDLGGHLVFALLPLLGGLLLGWLVPRRIAITAQTILSAIAVAILTISAPHHGGSYRDTLWIGPALALVGAAALLGGFRLRRATARRSSSTAAVRD
jgi:hypothetical protein